MAIQRPSRKKATAPNGLVKTPALEGSVATAPRSEDVARRAYEIFLARGGENGHDLDDWFEAERELFKRAARSRADSR